MKKFFLFAAVAGMLASCSSESLTGSDPNIEPTQEERVPIQLAVSSPSVRATTRGTGTVGGVGGGENKWYGQTINAFMFKKGLLTLAKESEAGPELYNDAAMFTPGIGTNIPSPTPTDKGEAMLTDGAIKYYPPSGNFDFFGYHVDDAKNGDLDKSANSWVVPFVINGSQDLMSTKAAPLAWAELTDAQKAKFANETAYKAFIDGEDQEEGALKGDFYSAKAARKEIQPVLKFDHLLTRLSFVIVPGNDNAGGWGITIPATYYTAVEAATENASLPGALNSTNPLSDEQATAYNNAMNASKSAGYTLSADEAAAYNATLSGAKHEGEEKTPAVYDQNAAKAVYVKSIEVESKTTGKMAVAWTGDDPEMITWDEATQGTPKWLQLKERPTYYLTDDKTFTISDALYDLLPVTAAYYVNNTDATIHISETAYAALDAGEQANYTEYTGDYYLKLDDPSDRISAMEYAGLDDDVKATYRKGYYKSNFTAVGADVANNNLTNLTPTYPKMTHAYDQDALETTEIGEALIVAPKDEAYNMKVTVSQKVPTNWNTIADPTTYEEKEVTYPLEIPKPDGGFKANTSYKVVLTVYGFERIQVTTMIIPWEQGATIPVGGDDD